MIFKKLNLEKCIKTICAHTHKLDKRIIKKGSILNAEDIKILKENGLKEIYVAILEENDVTENKASKIIAKSIVSKDILIKDASNGRCDFYSKVDGLLNLNEKKIIKINNSYDDIAICLLKNFIIVKKGQLIGNIKILPYAISKFKLNKIVLDKKNKNIISISKKIYGTIVLINTHNKSGSSNSKIKKSLDIRLQQYGLKISKHFTSLHDLEELKQTLKNVSKIKSLEVILIHGSTSITDINDIIPKAIKELKGEIISSLSPTDPGNLTLVAKLNNVNVLGVPGCAVSPKRNGFDPVLERICHNIIINKFDIASLSIGGLFKNVRKSSK